MFSLLTSTECIKLFILQYLKFMYVLYLWQHFFIKICIVTC